MRFLARVLFVLLLLFSIHYLLSPTVCKERQLCLLTNEVSAQGEFETDYDVLYKVNAGGLVGVTQNIVLKNKTPNYYADKFELKIGSTKVSDVKAQDITGPMETSVRFENNNLTIISVKFNQKVIGAGKTLPWTLTYSSSELATKSGQIWEISIPRLARSAEIGQYNTTVSVPITFGPIAFTTPNPKSSQKIGSNQEFTFDKEQLIESGIAMSFGEKQVFSFNLNYYLENQNLTNQVGEIVLPPDNNYQKVVFEKINPQPIDVTLDEDGNFKALYKLSPNESLEISVGGSVEVFSKPFRNIHKKLSDKQKTVYTQPQRYWETDSALIKDKARDLKTPESIYDFVSTYLSYSQERLKKPKLERMGALSALNSPKEAVCMEFTDLFIALARAAGIPAREVEGYAYTQNERLRPLSLPLSEGDILHAWPEYWDDQLGWVQVDPTWGSTSGGINFFEKLDFNHITFVQRGVSSTIPFPAGSYKKEGQENKKGVYVSFAQNLPTPKSTPELSLFLPDKIVSLVPVKVKAEVKNIGSVSIFNQKLTLTSSKLKNTSAAEVEIEILPPFAKKSFDFRLQGENSLHKTTDTIILTFADTQILKPVEILPVYKIVFFKTFIASLVLTSLIILIGLFIYHKTHKGSRLISQKTPQN